MSRLHTKSIGLWVLGVLCAAGPVHADGYWTTSSGEPLRSSDAACVKSGSWAPAPAVVGCDRISKPARIVLLPDPGGKAGAVVVKVPSGEQVLNEAYAGLQAPSAGGLQRTTESESSVRARYGEVLDARPPRPLTFVVRFETGSATKLTADSAVVLEELKTVLGRWPAPQLMVVGHTDRVGDQQANDVLSLKRAQAVGQQLIGMGIPAARLETAGRGEREPLVATDDGVANAANRRVEITLR